MNILYYSLHHILEDDEVRLFKKLGHNVCVLGVNSEKGVTESFRPKIEFNAEEEGFYRYFRQCGCEFDYTSRRLVLDKSFVDIFDVVIVMHNIDIIRNNWHLFHDIPVIWRTIGQGVDRFEDELRLQRDQGLYIVRYSDVERSIPNSLGQDAIIRFVKDPAVYAGWTGRKQNILTFSNEYMQRYPEDAADYVQIVEGLPSFLGGIGNEGISGSIGFVESDEQIECYKNAAVYLYASGLGIPYTLNFMEAWITGVPVVVHAPANRCSQYFEIDKLIEDGKTGFICRTVEETRGRIIELLRDQALATKIGQAGRAAAMAYFGTEAIAGQWTKLFETISQAPRVSRFDPVYEPALPHPNEPTGPFMQKVSPSIFETISLMRPFDIDIDKIRIGNERDGGYVLADRNLDRDVISFGVGPDVTFEHALAERGANVFLHDHTVGECPMAHPRFAFKKLGICGTGQDLPDLASIEQHLTAVPPDRTGMLLKMDVEGAEWDVFSTITQQTLSRFDQIVVEIHWLEHLVDPTFNAKAHASLAALNQQFTLFHVHGNNCVPMHIVDGLTVASVLEFSYIRTSLIKKQKSRTVYPASLNKANHPNYHDLPLLFYPFIPTEVEPYKFQEMIRRIDMEQKLDNS